jgi:vitamin B12 transporter
MRTIVLGLLALPQFVLAAVDEATDLSPVLVTATRTAQTADETLAPVSIVTRADLERRQVRSVPDALRGLPGVTFSNSGGSGKVSSLSLRGTNTSHLLVLVDGVRIGSATAGITSLETLPIEQIERIEVVRGPRSSLYGSEAIGGVIQIFTRKGGGPLRPRFSAGAGRYQTVNGSLGLSGGGDRAWFDATLSFEDTEGFNACRGEPFVGGCFTDEPDKDGYRNASGSLRAGYRFGNGDLGLHWLRSESEVEFDGFTNESSGVQQVLGAKANFSPLDRWDLKLSAGRSWDELDVLTDGRFGDRFETIRDTASWQNDVYFGEPHLVTLGLDFLKDSVYGTTDYTVDSRENWGLFGQYQGDFGAHRVTASMRYDDNEQFGGHATGDAAWGYGFDNGLRLTASYGTAFKAPSFNDLYYPFLDFGFGFGYSGNPDLDPEKSRSAEIGLSGRIQDATWAVNVYQTDLDDLISIDASGMISTPINVDTARIRGVEAVGSAQVWDWDLKASLTLLDPENRSNSANNGNLLVRRPEQTFQLDLDRELGRMGLGASLFAAGRSYDDLANRVRLDGYVLVDLRAEYRFTDSFRLQGRLENLFDEEYETVAYYNQPGRAFYLTLRYQP